MTWMRCPECNARHHFKQIGRVPPVAYQCVECGNVERGIECPDCGSSNVISPYWTRFTHCHSCGSSKHPVWSNKS